MRFISCKINGFGALSKFRVDFESRLHTVLADNGFGKSTLFDFIRVMLYGMPTTRSNEKAFSLRKHYRPFNVDAYGGVLTLQTREGLISIERSFGATSATDDTLKITDAHGNDLTTTRFKNIPSLGYHFLGLDEEAYERTVAFREVGANEGVGSNKTISAKLNSIATSIDVGQYDRAMAALDDMTKKLAGKGTRNISTITALDKELKKLSSDITALERLREQTDNNHQTLAELKKEHAQKEKDVEAARNLNRDRERWDNYQAKLLNVRGLQKELQSLLDTYPEGIPSKEIAQEIRLLGEHLKKIEIELDTLVFSDADREHLTLLKERYPQGAIPPSALDELEQVITERERLLSQREDNQFLKTESLESLQYKFQNWQNPSLSALEQTLRKSHDLDHAQERLLMTSPIEQPRSTILLNQGGVPSQEEMERIEQLSNQYKNNELQIQHLASQPTQTHAKYNKPIAIVGLVIVVIGLVMQVMCTLNYGIAVMFFGLAVVMFSFILKGSSNSTNQNNPAQALSQENVVLEHKLKTFFTRYNRYGTDFLAYFDELKDTIEQYKDFERLSRQQQEDIQKAKSELASSGKEIVDFISSVLGEQSAATIEKYVKVNPNTDTNKPISTSSSYVGFDIDFESNENGESGENDVSGDNGITSSTSTDRRSPLTRLLADLRNMYTKMIELQGEFEEVENKRKYLTEQIELCNQKIQAIVTQYDIPQENISIAILRQESADLQRLTKDLDRYTSQKEDLIKKRGELKQRIETIYQELYLAVPEDFSSATAKYTLDLERSEVLKKKIEEAHTDAEQYRQSIGLTEEPGVPHELREPHDSKEENVENEQSASKVQRIPSTPEEINAVVQEIKALEAQIARLTDQISQAERATAQLPSMIEHKQLKTQQLAQAKEELLVVNKTKEFIEKANKNILDKFVSPIMTRYQHQIKELLPWLGSVNMDHTYKVSFKKDSDVAHNCEHLSSGERTCLELALRLALIENMFQDDYPVLMMDDPFAELDPKNLKKALEIVDRISYKMQVVYFSCSPERIISQ